MNLSMSYCLLGLGSNLNAPLRQLTFAEYYLKRLPHTTVLKVAPYYRNPPWGKKTIPDYYNTVVLLKTRLPPFHLLKRCQQIETKLGRVRKVRCSARTIDIDILQYGTLVSCHPALLLPHPGMQDRRFVQIPLEAIQNHYFTL
jgi:2-amino-4-hydroxy-6-hydroxymethyldihydropteridine diphosphokinase